MTLTAKNMTESVEEPTRADRMAAVRWIAEHTNLVPVAHGPTASGKTHGFHKWAEELGTECITVLLSQHTPDEVAGFQTEVGGKLIAQPPYWFVKAQTLIDKGETPVILFDELGLAREEVRGAIYTFLRDREIHGMKLTGKAYVVGAMNPATLAPPLMSRVALIDFPADRNYLLAFAKHALARKAAEVGQLHVEGDPAYSNAPAPRPEIVHGASVDALNQMDGSFHKLPEPSQRVILEAIVPEHALREMMQDTLDVSVLAKRPADFRKVAVDMEAIDWNSVVDGILEALPTLTPIQRSKILFEILDSAYDDIDNRAEVYYSKERPEHIQQAALGIDNDKFWELVAARGFVRSENDELKGTVIDRWIEQRGEGE